MESICALVTDGTHDSPKLQPSGVPFIKGKHISQGYVDFATCDFITEADHAEACRRVKPRVGDVLFSNIGSVGDTARVSVDREFSIKNVALFRPDPTKVDPRYFYYLVVNPRFKESMLSLRSGSAQPFITLGSLRGYETGYHTDRDQQRRIASILSAYDDLIENNTRRIAILEEMARRIYEEWFVRFRFPGHEGVRMVESELGLVPEGWRVVEVQKIVRRLPAGAVYKQVDVGEAGSIPVIDQSSAELLGFHSGEPAHRATPGSPVVIFGDHTCKMQLMVVPFSLGPNTVPFVAEQLPVHYVYALVRGLVSTHEYKRHWSDLMKKKVLVSDDVLAENYAMLVQPMAELIECLRRVSRNLRSTRDELLPRLIAGELDVSAMPEPEALVA